MADSIFDEKGQKNKVNAAGSSVKLLNYTQRASLLLEHILLSKKDESAPKEDPKKSDATSPIDKPLSLDETLSGLSSHLKTMAVPKTDQSEKGQNLVKEDKKEVAVITGDQLMLTFIVSRFREMLVLEKEFEIKYEQINLSDAEIYLKSDSQDISKVKEYITGALKSAFDSIKLESNHQLIISYEDSEDANILHFGVTDNKIG